MASHGPDPVPETWFLLSRVFAAACWIAALACFILPLANPDIFWHLSAARRMAATGSFPRADWLSATMAGRPWMDFEWLCELLWYAVVKSAGMWGLVAVKAAFFAAAGACLWVLFGLYELSLELRGLALLAWIMGLAPSNDIRPENISMALFTLEFLALEVRRLGRLRLSDFHLGAVAAGLYILWANCHPGFVYGLVLFAIYAAADFRRNRNAALFAAAGACLAATLVNPYGIGLYRVVLEHAREAGALQQYIREWQEPTILSPWMTAFWIVMILTYAAVLVRYLRDRRVPVEHLAVVLIFSISGARHLRTSLYFTTVGVPIAALHWSGMDWRGARGKWIGRAAGAVAALAMCVSFVRGMVPELMQRHPFIPRYVPDQVTRFLDQERPVLGPHNMFNPWGWGGYLGYKLYPDYKIFVDGRYIFHQFLEPMEAARQSPEAYQRFMDGYGIDVVLQERRSQFFPLSVELRGGRKLRLLRPFYLTFLPRKDWALVFWGNQGLVFARRSKFPREWIRRHEFTLFRPDDLYAAVIEIQEGLAPWTMYRDEAERYLLLNPGASEAAAVRAHVEQLKR